VSILRNLFGRKEEEPIEMGPLYGEVRAAITDVQAYARSHGGEIRLLGVSDEGDVKIKLTGTCRGCPMSELTLKHGVEAQLKVLVPGVRKIIQVG
jgi:Fe-S cluster biogenesis protein NfuA